MAVKLYTPDANVIVHQAKVDFRRRIVQRQVNLVQYDKSMPIIAVQLYSNGNEYVLPETASAYIRFGKRDHTYVYNECLGCDQTRTIVYFAITDQMTVFYGEHTPIVELRIGDTVAGSGSIPIWIDRNPIQNGDTESKSDLSVFEKAIEAAQKIDVKLPTDLKATATNLSLLAGSTKIGSGINLSGFEYDEVTKTLKASGGGASVSPCLNLMDMTTDPPTVRTTITEEEKTNLENGLYTSVLYADLSLGSVRFYSMYFPETAVFVGGALSFSTFNLSVDDATESATISSSSSYSLMIGEKSVDGTYPITIEKVIEAPFGGGGGGSSTSIAFQDVTVSELANHVGEFGNFHITDMKVKMTILGSEQEFTGVNFSGTCSSTALYGTAWLVNGIILGCGTLTFDTVTKTIENGECSLGGTLSAVSVGNIFMPGAYIEFNSKYGADLIGTAIDTGSVLFVGKAEINNSGTQCIAYVGVNNTAPTGDETWCSLKGMFGNKGFGVAEFKKGADGNPAFKSFTTWLPPVTSADEGKSLVIKNGNAQWTDITSIHNHTIVIKEGTKIIFAANKELASATPVTTLETLISTFKDTTTAGFGDYILLTVDTAAKLKKQDGTEVNLSTLNVTIEDIL